MRKLFVIGAVLALAASASAAPYVGNATQKGTVIILPDIRVDAGPDGAYNYDTIVRLSNDAASAVDVRCSWIDGNKNRTHFTITLTKYQTAWFSARDGSGEPYTVNPMPAAWSGGIDNPFLPPPPRGDGPYRKGMLICFAVNADETDVLKFNHLYATATVFSNRLGTAYEYNGYAFTALQTALPPLCTTSTSSTTASGTCSSSGTTCGGTCGTPCPPPPPAPPCRQPGQITLDGVEFDQCPAYLAGALTPDGHRLSSKENSREPGWWFDVDRVRLAVAMCDLDLRQDYALKWTKLQFDVWDHDENKRGGGFECADSWHEVIFPNLDAGGQVFLPDTSGARYTVRAVRSDQCQTDPPTRNRGLLGVQATLIDFGQEKLAEYGTTLAGAGKFSGKIWWDEQTICQDQTCGTAGVPEGRIR